MKNLIYILLLTNTLASAQQVISKEIQLNNGEIELPGTLTYPKSASPIPLVIFIHGSGNVDRNGNQGFFVQGNYIKMLADSLNTKGIAFYRYDKRTASPDNLKKLKGTLLTDFVADAKIAASKFLKDERFNGIHLIGHSQGSLVGMLAVDKTIKSYCSLAGTANTIDKTIIQQITNQDSTLASITKDHIAELIAADTIIKVNPNLYSLFAPPNQKFFKNWMSFNPSIEIKKLTLPTLIVNGDADLQVPVIEAEQLKASKPDAQLKIISKMNHVLKTISLPDNNLKSYTDPSFPISKELVNVLSVFIKTNE